MYADVAVVTVIVVDAGHALSRTQRECAGDHKQPLRSVEELMGAGVLPPRVMCASVFQSGGERACENLTEYGGNGGGGLVRGGRARNIIVRSAGKEGYGKEGAGRTIFLVWYLSLNDLVYSPSIRCVLCPYVRAHHRAR